MSTISFACMEDELCYYKNLAIQLELSLYDARVSLREVQLASRELDGELEREIEQIEKAYGEMKAKMEQQESEIGEWKIKYYKSQHDRMAMLCSSRNVLSTRVWVRYGQARAISFRREEIEMAQVTILDDLIPLLRPRINALKNVEDDCIKLRRHPEGKDLTEDTSIESLYNNREDAWLIVVCEN